MIPRTTGTGAGYPHPRSRWRMRTASLPYASGGKCSRTILFLPALPSQCGAAPSMGAPCPSSQCSPSLKGGELPACAAVTGIHSLCLGSRQLHPAARTCMLVHCPRGRACVHLRVHAPGPVYTCVCVRVAACAVRSSAVWSAVWNEREALAAPLDTCCVARAPAC